MFRNAANKLAAPSRVAHYLGVATLICGIGVLAGFPPLAHAHDVISTRITWNREIGPLLVRRCGSCHRERGRAFPLTRYDQARPWAVAIRDSVQQRTMPPWNAMRGFGAYRNDASLTQEEIALIVDWVNGGAPEADRPSPGPSLPQSLPASLGVPSRPEVAATGKPGRVPANRTGSTWVRLTPSKNEIPHAAVIEAIELPEMKEGAAFQAFLHRPDGSREPLVWVRRYVPGAGRTFEFLRPLDAPAHSRVLMVGPPGTTLRLRVMPGRPGAQLESGRTPAGAGG